MEQAFTHKTLNSNTLEITHTDSAEDKPYDG